VQIYVHLKEVVGTNFCSVGWSENGKNRSAIFFKKIAERFFRFGLVHLDLSEKIAR
jgi:hypothetical protein